VESFDKSTRLSSCALVELKRRDRFYETLVESRDLVRSDVLEFSEPHVAGDYRRKTPVIGPAQRANASDLEFLRIEFDDGSFCGRCQAGCRTVVDI
jgi:hypothetical protein